MKYRALLKKNLRSLELISGEMKPGLKVSYKQKEIGEIISCTNKFAISMLRINEANQALKDNVILKTDNAKLKIIR